MKKLFAKSRGDEHDFWMSYTDLMSAFLIVFIIAAICFFHKYQEKERLLQISQQEFARKTQEMTHEIAVMREKNNQLQKLSDETLQEMIALYAERKDLLNLNTSFKQVFANIDGCVIDTMNQSIRFYPTGKEPDIFRFTRTTDESAAEIRPNFTKRLDSFGREFIKRAMELSTSYDIQEIRIEGHCDTRGDFIDNMKLSSFRAKAVYDYIYNKCKLTAAEKQFMRNYVIAVGYSYARPIGANGQVYSISNASAFTEDQDKSRRVEFRIISRGKIHQE